VRRVGKARIVVPCWKPRSNSMRLGAHAAQLAPSLIDADQVVFLKRAELPWDAQPVMDALQGRARAAGTVDELLELLNSVVREGDHVVFMSNGGFESAPTRFAGFLHGR
jgi:UDP-N-acetylmuramate: L-alanyl-gamma-D-glutamyl-meso-diaminopimelate ligase